MAESMEPSARQLCVLGAWQLESMQAALGTPFQLFLSLASPLPATQASILSLPCPSPGKDKQQIPTLSTYCSFHSERRLKKNKHHFGSLCADDEKV